MTTTHISYSAPVPMLAYPYSENHVAYPCIVQPKYNGVRAMISPEGRVFARHGREIRHVRDQFGAYGIWIDGEIILTNHRLQDVTGLVNRREADDETAKLEFRAFDVIDKSLTQLGRLDLLNSHDHRTAPLFTIADSQLVKSLAAAHALHTTNHHTDGLIFRNCYALYQAGRSRALHKRKDQFDAEFLCVGAIEGLKSFTGTLGALTLRTESGATFECGGGYTLMQRREFWNDKPLNKMITVSYPYKSTRGIPQCPQFICVREGNA